MTCDYETRWRILERLILSEIRWYDFLLRKDPTDGLRKTMHWMLAIDAGIGDVERIKEWKTEDDKK
jgi:hypothetical protein